MSKQTASPSPMTNTSDATSSPTPQNQTKRKQKSGLSSKNTTNASPPTTEAPKPAKKKRVRTGMLYL